jgi:2,5-diketo-D-gluconate reductase A
MTRAIGVSNFTEVELEQLLKTAKIVPAVNQIELHPRLPQTDLVTFCQNKNIVVTAYSPLARGSGVLDHPKMLEVANRRNVSTAQAALRWNVERGVAVIPKSVTPSRIKANADIFTFAFDETDMETIKRVEDGVSTATSPWSTSGPIGARNRIMKPIIEVLLRPVFLFVKVDVQKMGRPGFLRWAWGGE